MKWAGLVIAAVVFVALIVLPMVLIVVREAQDASHPARMGEHMKNLERQNRNLRLNCPGFT